MISSIISAISNLCSKAVSPITNLIDDKRFTEQERAEFAHAIALAELERDRAELEAQRTELKIQIAQANADAQIAQANARVFEFQTREDDRFTKRLRPTVGYLMTIMLALDQICVLFRNAESYFTTPMLIGYFTIMGIYVSGRSFEKIKICIRQKE